LIWHLQLIQTYYYVRQYVHIYDQRMGDECLFTFVFIFCVTLMFVCRYYEANPETLEKAIMLYHKV